MRALVREVSRTLADAVVREVSATAIDPTRAAREHTAYVAALRGVGVEVVVLPALHAHPDACFVEDTAVVADGLALATRPGHPSRLAEVDTVVEALQRWVPVVRLAQGSLDGGDVLRIGRRMYVGRSARTDAAGAAGLQAAFPAYEVVPAPLRDGLHLKSGATALPDGRLLVAADRVDPASFTEPVIVVPPEEADACNVVAVGDVLLVATGFPITLQRLRREGFRVVEVDNTELRKADSALTCLSLLVDD